MFAYLYQHIQMFINEHIKFIDFNIYVCTNVHMKFEWDKDKNKRNKLKHGLSFIQVLEIFTSEYITLISGSTTGEKREVVIGEIDDYGVTFVVITKRGDSIRLISARKASRKERRLYYAHKKNIA